MCLLNPVALVVAFLLYDKPCPETSVSVCVLQYLKSYGPDWENVRLDLLVEGKLDKTSEEWIQLKKLQLRGSHNSRTSINYSEQIDLGSQLQVGSSVRATFTVVQGTQFQINGLALCHSFQPIESFT